MNYLNLIKTIYFTLFLICYLNSFSQNKKQFQINFEPVFSDKKLELENKYYKLNNQADSIVFTNLKFYITNIKLLNNSKTIFKEKNSYHLVNLNDSNSLALQLNLPTNTKFTSIQFNLGVDSATNSKGVLGGDLDPTKGMYWAWHSGYINFKLEGKSNLCITRNNVFEFHLGGYKFPYNNIQTIVLKTINKNHNIIKVDIEKFISAIDISKTNMIMTPSKKANELSQIVSKIFSID